METYDEDTDDEMLEPDVTFSQTVSLNANISFENKIMRKVEEMLEDKNKKILELEKKIDKIITFNEEIIKNKELEIMNLKKNFDEFKKISDKNFELVMKRIDWHSGII